MKNYLIFTMAILFGVLISSCQTEDEIDVTLNQWKVEKIKKEGNSEFTFTEADYILDFLTKTTFSINLDVNNCGGSYEVKSEGEIQFTALGCTEACCDTEIAQDISIMLENMTTYAAQGNNKLILEGKGQMVLIKI